MKNAALYESGIVVKKRMLLILVGEAIDHIEVDSVLLDDHVVIEAISLVEHRLRGETGLPIRDTGLRVALDDILETERAFLTEVRGRMRHIERQPRFSQQRLTDLLAMQLIEFNDTFIAQVQNFLGLSELYLRGTAVHFEVRDSFDAIICLHAQMAFGTQETDDVPKRSYFVVTLGFFVLLHDAIDRYRKQIGISERQIQTVLQAMECRQDRSPVIGNTILDTFILKRFAQILLHLLVGMRILGFEQRTVTENVHCEMRAAHLTELFETLELHLGFGCKLGLIVTQEDET